MSKWKSFGGPKQADALAGDQKPMAATYANATNLIPSLD